MITSRSSIGTCSSDCINFVEEDDTGLFGPGHLEDLSDHPSTLSHILLDKLGTNNSNEASICSIGHSSGCEGLSCSWGTVKEHTLRRINTELDEFLGGQQRHFYHLSEFLQLLSAASNISISDIRLIFHCHHCHCSINLRWKWHLNHIFLSINTYTHAFFHISGSQFFTQFHYKFGNLFDVNNIFVFFAVANNFVAPSHLQRLLTCQFSVPGQIPLSR